MAPEIRNLTRATNILASLILLAGIVMFAINNLGNRYFWSDEASSFLTSLGFPPVGQQAGTLAESWSANQSHVEPGLFNWLERFWSLGIGSDIVSMRALPFVFFLVYVLSLLLLSRIVSAPWFLGCAAVSLMLLENITPYYAVEFRPSIAGLSASVVLPLAAVWLTLSKSTAKGLLVFIPVFLFFGSMQYTTFPIIIGLAGLLLVTSFKESQRAKRNLLRVAALVSLLWLPVVYVLLKGNPFDLAGGDSFKNISEVYIPNMPLEVALRTISTNFFSFTALPRTLFLVLVPILWIANKYPLLGRESDKSQWGVNALWVVVFLGTAASAAAGILGFIPWILGTRWSITEIGLIALSLVGLVGLVSQSRYFANSGIRIVVMALTLVVCFGGAYRMATYERTPGFNWNAALSTMLSGPPQSALVDSWTYPELRYWVEYSGQYDQFREAWINHGIQVAGPDDKADLADIENFIVSDASTLLLRSESLLEGIDIPANIRVERIETWGDTNTVVLDPPVLLVRQ